MQRLCLKLNKFDYSLCLLRAKKKLLSPLRCNSAAGLHHSFL